MSDPGCFWHGEEPIPENAYQVCGECGHVWATYEDLEADIVALRKELGPRPNPEPRHRPAGVPAVRA